MTKSDDIIQISKILGIDVGTSAGGTLTKEWLVDILETLEHELTDTDSDKVSIAKIIFLSNNCINALLSNKSSK